MQSTVQVPQVHIQPQPVQQQVVVTSGNTGRIRHNYASSSAMCLGVMQLAIGILCILLQNAGILIVASIAFIGTGIWCGILFIIAGAFGIASSRTKTNGYIITFMVMSIISAAFITTIVSFSGIGVGMDARLISNCQYSSGSYNSYNCHYITIPGSEGKIAVNSLLLILALVELVCAIWSSVLGCKVCCCSTPGQPGTVVRMQYIQPNQPQVVFKGQGQVMPNQQTTVFAQGAVPYPNQPVMVQQHFQPQPPPQSGPIIYNPQAFPSPVGMQQTTIGHVQQPIMAGPPAYMYQQQATVPQQQTAPSGGEYTSLQTTVPQQQTAPSGGEYTSPQRKNIPGEQGGGGYVKLEEDTQ